MKDVPKIRLSLIIPAFNEEANFKRGVLDQVFKYLKKHKYNWEVLLVNDGSTDSTLKLLSEFSKKHSGFKVVDIPHGGKVAAVSAGVKEAKGEIILFSDFDQSTPITEVAKVLEKFEHGADVVIGERKGEDVNTTRLQWIRSKVFNLFVQLIALPGIKDTQCGFKAFKNQTGKKLFGDLKVTHRTQKGGYMGAFDVEILYLARKNGLKIETIPVSWKHYESNRLSALEPVKMLRDIIMVKFLDLKGGYSKLGFSSVKDKSFFSGHLFIILLLLLLTFPAFKDTLTVGYFPMHDDLQFGRQIIMDKCFKDGQIPCRWSEDLGYGFGYPMFNFYPPFPYYFGQIFRLMGMAYIDIVKALVVLNFVISGLTMYLLAQRLWGRWGGLISGLMFVYAPYHSVDIYARGAMNEAWAITFFPAVFWAILKLIEENKWRYVLATTFFTALVMLSHNLMLMLFAPFAALWAIFWVIRFKRLSVIPKLIASAVWAFGLAAFFTMPVMFEQKYAHVETLIIGYFNYLAHFATVSQLFLSNFWGYGDSRFGPVDDISFQIGYLHWGLSLVAIIVALVIARKKQWTSLAILLIFMITLFYTFLAHEKSSFIWSAFPPIQFLQFPWRTLSISIFGTSILAGSIVFLFDWKYLKQIKPFAIAATIIATLFLYKDYFHWKDHWPWVSDPYKMSGELWRLQTTAGIFDYLPKWAPLPPPDPPNGDAEIIEGEGEIKLIKKNSVKQEYQVNVKKDSTFQINTFYFPGFRYFVNDKEVAVDPTKDKLLGRPRIGLTPGEHKVVAKLTDTPVRLSGNVISLISWVLLICATSSIILLRRTKRT